MENIVAYFSTMPTTSKFVWLLICLVLASAVELWRPLIGRHRIGQHSGVNAVFIASDLTLNLIFTALLVLTYQWLEVSGFGLLNLLSMPLWVQLLLSVMVLDLVSQYFVHYLLHKVPLLFRFHMIHHSDTEVAATSGLRHHPGDYAVREVFALATIVLFGIPLAFYVLYRMLTIFFALFTHANIRMPRGLDRALHWVLVTPNLHKFHHHREMPWTDTNFGNLFSIWDRLFGTLCYDDLSKVRYGLDVLDNSRDRDLMYQLKIPFDRSIKGGGEHR